MSAGSSSAAAARDRPSRHECSLRLSSWCHDSGGAAASGASSRATPASLGRSAGATLSAPRNAAVARCTEWYGEPALMMRPRRARMRNTIGRARPPVRTPVATRGSASRPASASRWVTMSPYMTTSPFAPPPSASSATASRSAATDGLARTSAPSPSARTSASQAGRVRTTARGTPSAVSWATSRPSSVPSSHGSSAAAPPSAARAVASSTAASTHVPPRTAGGAAAGGGAAARLSLNPLVKAVGA